MSLSRPSAVRLIFLAGLLLFVTRTFAADELAGVLDALNAKDYKAAWDRLEPLLRAGQDRALYMAGLMTQKGEGVEADPAKAIEFYERSAAKGFHPAMNNLGVAYREGHGVQRDFAKALDYFKDAALRGNSQSALSAGALYVNGQGVKSDYVEGYAWYLLSGDDLAKRNARELESYMTAPQVDQAKARSEELRRQAAEIGRPKAPAGTVRMALQLNDKGELVVKSVRPGSSAAEAGIQAGDVLVEVEGKKVADLQPQQIGQLIEGGPADSIIQLRLLRGGSTVQVAMPRDPVAPAPAVDAPANPPVNPLSPATKPAPAPRNPLDP